MAMETLTEELRELLGTLAGALADKSTDAQAIGLQARLLIMKLKAANRHAADEREAGRQEAGAARAQLDATNLELQNYLYEQRFYESQVKANLEYRCLGRRVQSACRALVCFSSFMPATGGAGALGIGPLMHAAQRCWACMGETAPRSGRRLRAPTRLSHRSSVTDEALALKPEAEFLAGLSAADRQQATADAHKCMLMRLDNERQLRQEAVRLVLLFGACHVLPRPHSAAGCGRQLRHPAGGGSRGRGSSSALTWAATRPPWLQSVTASRALRHVLPAGEAAERAARHPQQGERPAAGAARLPGHRVAGRGRPAEGHGADTRQAGRAHLHRCIACRLLGRLAGARVPMQD